jgi:GAF domain-containing protein
MIAQMASRLNAQRTLQGALDTVLKDTMAFVGVQCGLIRLLDETGGLLLVAQKGFDYHFALGMRRLTLEAGTASGRAASTKQPVFISEVEEDQLFAPFRDFAQRAKFHSVLSVPMVAHGGACVGVISTFFGRQKAPTAIEQEMLVTYGRIAADRILALIGREPVSARAQEFYDKLTARLQSKKKAHEAVSDAISRAQLRDYANANTLRSAIARQRRGSPSSAVNAR